jgi:hypothetical protein
MSRALPFLLDSVLWAIISSDLTQHDVDSAQWPLRSTSRVSALSSTGETASGFPSLLLAGSFLHSGGDIFDTKTGHDFLVLVDANIVDPRASSGKDRASANANANVNALVRLDVIRSLSPAGLSTYDGFTSGLRLKELFIRRSVSSSFLPFCSAASDTVLTECFLGCDVAHTCWSIHSSSKANPRLRTTLMDSTLSTSSSTAPLFRAYATLVNDAISRNTDVGSSEGPKLDKLRELEADLWTLHDVFVDEDEDGEDEEYDDE